jgi:Xaa-Pro aminopeptidase
MKADIDRLMRQRQLDGLWISGSVGDNPALDYFVGSAHLSHINILKKVGEPPVLYHRLMERDEASATGLETVLVSQSEVVESLEQAGGDDFTAIALRLQHAFKQQEISGRIAAYGQKEVGQTLAIVRKLEELMPASQFVNDSGADGTLRQARLTKDDDELEQMRRIGQITIEVVDLIARYLQSRPVEEGVLLDDEGQPVTVGQIKRKIHLLLAERGAESPSGPIFAPGRQGAIGHSTGLADQVLRLGVPIVFDIYPRMMAGGYFFDFTRTWCLGYAPEEVIELHQQVSQVYHDIFPKLTPGTMPMEVQIEVCQKFEAMGHPTLLSSPDTQSGYFHGLAHGLGLAIHEAPVFRNHDGPSNLPLAPRMVITHEPGLYYPERGMGVRIEDALVIQEEGPPQVLVDYPHDLVLPMEAG